jgi:hypothetical protein
MSYLNKFSEMLNNTLDWMQDRIDKNPIDGRVSGPKRTAFVEAKQVIEGHLEKVEVWMKEEDDATKLTGGILSLAQLTVGLNEAPTFEVNEDAIMSEKLSGELALDIGHGVSVLLDLATLHEETIEYDVIGLDELIRDIRIEELEKATASFDQERIGLLDEHIQERTDLREEIRNLRERLSEYEAVTPTDLMAAEEAEAQPETFLEGTDESVGLPTEESEPTEAEEALVDSDEGYEINGDVLDNVPQTVEEAIEYNFLNGSRKLPSVDCDIPTLDIIFNSIINVVNAHTDRLNLIDRDRLETEKKLSELEDVLTSPAVN